jgi:sugar transport system (permease) (binding protein dependent transporter)
MDYTNYMHVRSDAEKRSRRRKIIRRNVIGTLMASPPFIGFLCFTMIPMILSLGISFTELHSYNLSLAKFTGFDNYLMVLKSDMLWTSVLNTLYFCLSVPINICASLFLAYILTRKIFFGKLARIILFIPQVCSTVAVTLMWQWIFEDNYGVINTVLSGVGLAKIPFMTDKNWFMPAVLTISLWQNGTNVVLLQAAFVNVNKSLQEAARLDGASERKVFWRVTLPALTPTLFYILTMNLITALQEQTVMQIITTNGVGPGYRALTLVYYIYRMAFTYTATMGMGMACALSWIVALLILLITKINFWLSKKWVCYD